MEYYFSHKNHPLIGDVAAPKLLQEYVSIIDYGGIEALAMFPLMMKNQTHVRRILFKKVVCLSY